MTAMRPPVDERLEVLRQVRGAHQLEDHVERPAIGEALWRDRLGAQLRDLIAQLLAAHRRGHARARRPGELDRRGAHASGAAVHEQVLAGAQPGLGEQGVVRRGEHLRQPTGRGPVERVGHGHELALVDRRQLRLAAAADDRHHTLAHREALGPRPERCHLAGELEAGDVRWRAGRRGIQAAPLHHVGPVQPRRTNLDEHLPRARRGDRGAPRSRSRSRGW